MQIQVFPSDREISEAEFLDVLASYPSVIRDAYCGGEYYEVPTDRKPIGNRRIGTRANGKYYLNDKLP